MYFSDAKELTLFNHLKGCNVFIDFRLCKPRQRLMGTSGPMDIIIYLLNASIPHGAIL